MNQDVILYTNPMSRGRIARWMLEEVGCPYTAEVLDYGAAMHTAEYLAINPMGKVPAIRHGSRIVTETAAICAYLADAFPEAGLAPPPAERAAYYRALFFVAGPVEQAVINRAMNVPAEDEQQQIMAGYGTYARTLDALEKLVPAEDFVCGERFTAADVFLGAHISWGLRFGTLEPRPAFAEYWARLSDRPALKRATELDGAVPPKEEASA